MYKFDNCFLHPVNHDGFIQVKNVSERSKATRGQRDSRGSEHCFSLKCYIDLYYVVVFKKKKKKKKKKPLKS